MKRNLAVFLLGLVLAGCSAGRTGGTPYRPKLLAAGAGTAGVDGAGAGPGGAAGTPAAPPAERAAAITGTLSATLPAPDEVLDLPDSLRLALANHRSIDIADRRVAIEEDRKLETLGVVLPRLTAESRFQVRNNDQGFGSDGEGEDFVTGERDLQSARLSLLVPLYDFGGARNQLRAQNRTLDASRRQAERTRQDVELAVTQAYFRVLEARKIRGVVEESLATVREQLAIAQDLFEQGMVAKNDVLVAEVQLARRQEDLIRAEKNIALSRAALNRLMGLPVTQRTEIADISATELWRGEFEPLVELALNQRADLSALGAQVEAARARHAAARKGLFPRLFGFGNYNASSDESQLNPSWFEGGLGVQLSLWDTQTVARIGQAAKLAAEAFDVYRERADDIVLEVQSAYLDVREATERLPVTQKSVEQAAENLRVTRDRYREGLVTSAEVLTEEERLARARSDAFRALYDYHQAYARLVHTLGTEPPDSTAQARVVLPAAAAPNSTSPHSEEPKR